MRRPTANGQLERPHRQRPGDDAVRRPPLKPQQQPGLDEEGEQAAGAEGDRGGEPGAQAELARELGRRQRADTGAELVGGGDGGEEERASARGAEDATHERILALSISPRAIRLGR